MGVLKWQYRVINCFLFFTFSQSQEEYSPITLLRVTFSVWRQCLHRLYSVYHYTSPYKEAVVVGGGKKDEVTDAVSSTVKGGTKISTQLSSVNWNKSSSKTPVCEIIQWPNLCSFWFSVALKFPWVHFNSNNREKKSQISHIGVLSSISCDISRDKTVIKRQRNTDLSFRRD